jgi:translation initiation factor 2 beta subunit (eIF-2beta)/eIF-5
MSLEITLAKDLNRFKDIKEDLAMQMKINNDKLNKCEEDLIELLVESGKSSTGHIDGVGQLSLVRSVYPSVLSENMPAFIETLRGTPDAGIIKEVIAAPTLKKYLQDKIQETTEFYIEHPEECEGSTPSAKAKEIWAAKGVKTFEDIRLQHRNRGK